MIPLDITILLLLLKCRFTDMRYADATFVSKRQDIISLET